MANEKRLIDANALIGAIDEYMKVAYDCPLSEAEDFRKKANSYRVARFVEGLYEATELIEEAPTVDAVEVVRCKDCIYATGYSDEIYCDGPIGVFGTVGFNDFCSYGERREGE